jgi:hypothetical protein
MFALISAALIHSTPFNSASFNSTSFNIAQKTFVKGRDVETAQRSIYRDEEKASVNQRRYFVKVIDGSFFRFYPQEDPYTFAVSRGQRVMHCGESVLVDTVNQLNNLPACGAK